jgi:hypothetical protein
LAAPGWRAGNGLNKSKQDGKKDVDTMTYVLRGSLCGQLCDDCQEPLVGLELRLYQAAGQNMMHAAVAPEKDTFRAVAEDELAGRTLIATGEIGPGGGYSVEIDSEGYDGGPIEIDVYCGTVPRPKVSPHAVARQFDNGTLHSPPQTPEGHFTSGAFFFRGGAGGPHNGSNTGGTAISIAGDPPCAYVVNLGWVTRRWKDSPAGTYILYCK